jgi:hypothetical protein
MEALARGGDVVVEEQDGGLDEAEVEDEVDAVDPDGEESAGGYCREGVSVLKGISMRLCSRDPTLTCMPL